MIESLMPPGIEPFWALFLVAFSAVTSFTTAAAGIGGGTILVAVMAVIGILRRLAAREREEQQRGGVRSARPAPSALLSGC